MNPTDFEREDIQERIKTINIANIFSNPFKTYNSLTKLEKLNFKREMNKYIKENLNKEDWEDNLIRDYNEVVCSFMDDPVAFDPSKHVCDTNFQPEFLLSDEQRAFHGNVRSITDLCGEPSVLKQLQSQTSI